MIELKRLFNIIVTKPTLSQEDALDAISLLKDCVRSTGVDPSTLFYRTRLLRVEAVFEQLNQPVKPKRPKPKPKEESIHEYEVSAKDGPSLLVDDNG